MYEVSLRLFVVYFAPLRIRVFFRLHRTLRRLLSEPEDVVPGLQRSSVVYQIPCPASYIGRSGRRLEQWIKEHRRAVVAADFNSSAVAEHAWTSGHPVDWASVKVLSVMLSRCTWEQKTWYQADGRTNKYRHPRCARMRAEV